MTGCVYLTDKQVKELINDYCNHMKSTADMERFVLYAIWLAKDWPTMEWDKIRRKLPKDRSKEWEERKVISQGDF